MRGKIVWTSLTGVLALGLMLFFGYVANTLPALFLDQRLVDFRMRCNEARCVRMGIDPYEVWKERVHVSAFVPWDFQEAVVHHEVVPYRNYVHAYPPWEYSVIMPFTFGDDVASACCWLGLLWGVLIAGTCAAFLVGYRKSHCLWIGFLAVSVVGFFGSSLLACLLYGNYGIVVACAVAVAIWLHGRGVDGWAGLVWGLAMVKPQTALLFIMPLMCLRKWRTLGVIATFITLLTLVPCILCQRAPWTMVFAIVDYSAGQFFETGFIAQSVFVRLVCEGGVSPALLTGGSAMFGALICGALTLVLARMSRERRLVEVFGEWHYVIVFLPALVLSTVWTATRVHDHSIQVVTSIILLCVSAHAGCSRMIRVCAAVIIPILVVSSFESGFGWSINVFRFASVVGLLIFTIGLTGAFERRSLTFYICDKWKLFAKGLLALVLTGVAAHGISSVGKSMEQQPPLVRDQQMIDFHMRRNEACCVREGKDPFLVWRGDICDKRFTPWSFALGKGEHALASFRRFVHAYPPWEYALMQPFTWMEQRAAGSCYIGIMYLSLAVLSCLALILGHRLTGHWWCGCLMLAAVWRFFVPYACCIMYGNFGVVIAALMAVALIFQSRGMDLLAGVCWTLCFVKPQVAVIILIPLLSLRKWRTLLTIGGCLTFLTLIPSILCRRSPWAMLVCIREYSVNQFNALALISANVFQTLTEEGGIAASTLIMSSSLLVGAICLLLTFLLTIGMTSSRTDDLRNSWIRPMVVFVPAMLLSTVWTSSRLHDLSVQSVTAGLVILLAFVIRDISVRIVSALLAVCLCCQYMDIFLMWNVNPFQAASVVLLSAWCWVVVRWNKMGARC